MTCLKKEVYFKKCLICTLSNYHFKYPKTEMNIFGLLGEFIVLVRMGQEWVCCCYNLIDQLYLY